MYLPKGESVSFVAKFDDYADDIHPFMYHCHFSNHEDGGMMGQFIVTNPTGINKVEKSNIHYNIYPNPTQNKLFVEMPDANNDIYYITIFDVMGRSKLMLPKPNLQNGIDINFLSKGTYTIQIMDTKTKSISSQKFVKQ